jgi:hypothetical protein
MIQLQSIRNPWGISKKKKKKPKDGHSIFQNTMGISSQAFFSWLTKNLFTQCQQTKQKKSI